MDHRTEKEIRGSKEFLTDIWSEVENFLTLLPRMIIQSKLFTYYLFITYLFNLSDIDLYTNRILLAENQNLPTHLFKIFHVYAKRRKGKGDANQSISLTSNTCLNKLDVTIGWTVSNEQERNRQSLVHCFGKQFGGRKKEKNNETCKKMGRIGKRRRRRGQVSANRASVRLN